MPPRYNIRNPDATYTDISEYFRLYELDVATNAEEGSVAQSTITAHDPDGTFDIIGHRQIRIHEDTATGSNTMIYVGFTGDRRISRGVNRAATGRDWEIDLLDPNSILARRILTGSDSNRPAETDVARIQWLVSTNESGMVNDSLYVNTTGPVDMDAKDYTGQRFNEVIDDCAQASGKNYHLWYRESTGTFSLWYDFATSTSQSSPLRLTNVDTEVDNVLTFAISNDTQLGRSPDRVNSGVYLPYDGGVVYVQDGTTSNSFARRDVTMPAENVTTLAKATARADRYLTEMDTEEDVITTSVILPAAKVNFLTAGMRVQLKATHLPGYEDYTWCRAMNRSVNQISEENYALKLELSPNATPVTSPHMLIAVLAISGAGGSGVRTDQSTNGWTKAFWSGDYADAAQFPGPGGPGAWGIWYRPVVAGESAAVLTFNIINPGNNAGWVYEVSGVSAVDVQTINSNDSLTYSAGVASTVASPSAVASSVFFGGFALQKVTYGQVTLITTTQGTKLINANSINVEGGVCTVTGDADQPRMWIGHRTGTGVLTVGGTIDCSGATPDYNVFGRGKGGILLPLDEGGTFAVVQSAFNATPVAGTLTVTLPSPPTP